MGSGIAQVFAEHGFATVVFDPDPSVLEKAKNRIIRFAPDAINNITFTSSPHDCIADFVIEAIIENEIIKAELFHHLESINGADTIYATNTSSLAVSKLAEKMKRPENFAGMHFFNPAPLMKLVEVVTTTQTSEATRSFIATLAEGVGKITVTVKDSPGFVVNRVARPYYLEALYLVEQEKVDHQLIDDLMEAAGFRMGPFRLMDLIGNDINYSVSSIVYEALGRPGRLKPSKLQQSMVKEGALGRKSGKGYYEYRDS